MALCSLSTGSTATPFCARRVHHEAAGHHEHFLVRQRDGLAGLDRAEHGVERRGAGRRAQARCRRRDARRSRTGLRCRRRRLPPAIRRARRAACPSPRRWPSPPRADGTRGPASPSPRRWSPRRSPRPRRDRRCVRATSSALVPIDPVEPRMAMRFMQGSTDYTDSRSSGGFVRSESTGSKTRSERSRTMPLEPAWNRVEPVEPLHLDVRKKK